MKRVILIAGATLIAMLVVGCGPRVRITDEKTIQGTPGAPGTPGSDGHDGRDGTNGQDGANGANGLDGSNGTNGRDGVDGRDGTEVTMVQFCSGQPNSYPTSFPEYGFCIGGVLYGTYWDGSQAWTAKILPGNYRSTATGLGCNFAVAANCVVTP